MKREDITHSGFFIKVCEGGWVMNDETLVNPDHITINSSWSEGDEDVNDIRPKNQGEGKNMIFCTSVDAYYNPYLYRKQDCRILVVDLLT